MRRALAFSALVLAGCAPDVPEGSIEVVATHPHDPAAYTQGLLFHEGMLYESTGRYGESDLRKVEPRSGKVVERVELDPGHFGEGLARVGDSLIQLTWKEDVALVYDLATLRPRGSMPFDTRGWGLCFDGSHLYSTGGGSMLARRDPATLEALEHIQVVADGTPVTRANELECVGDHIYANVYRSEEILKIDKATGRVVARFDASGLVPDGLRGDADAVLNGIAHDPSTGRFYLTGKRWPVMYEVELEGG